MRAPSILHTFVLVACGSPPAPAVPPASLPPEPPPATTTQPRPSTKHDAKECATDAECRLVEIERLERQRDEAFDDRVEDFRQVYCVPSSRTDTHDVCERLDVIVLRVRRVTAEEMVRRGDNRTAGRSYWAMYVAYCTPPQLAGTPCDELLFEAHHAFTAAGDRADAERARKTLLDPKNGLSDSPLARKLRDP